jgi:hypothetical protein
MRRLQFTLNSEGAQFMINKALKLGTTIYRSTKLRGYGTEKRVSFEVQPISN